MRRYCLWLILAPLLTLAPIQLSAQTELNALLMQSTFKIIGPSHQPGKQNVGTVFIVGKPSPTAPNRAIAIMVTANHVLSDIVGETATLIGRELDSSGVWHKTNFTFKIRAGTNDLWSKHKTLDIAAIPMRLPRKMMSQILSTEYFITKERAESLQLHPGDALYCLGYPLGMEGNAIGFPILRKGVIASYPILPVKDNPTFAFAFDVFGGNSGGPVYLYEISRKIGNKIDIGVTSFGIAGIVVSERTFQNYTETLREKRVTDTPVAISDVIQAEFILELLEQIPSPP